MHFTREHVDQAIDHVIQTNGALTNYSQLFSAAGLPSADPQVIDEFMTQFHQRCAERGLPPLDALVVHAAGPRRDFPDAAYFRLNNQPDPLIVTATIADKRDATTFWLHQIQTCKLWSTRTSRQ
ncbi:MULTISPECIES: hypothetical protein [Actinokineospora]|uniref:Uncharacterized protein n=1 Tax=Actinokineospora fastidiosa TaxID=1816 RepID=A0A918LFR1_9PSEU|nr:MULTISPECIES: hypothetical protein [Actinokineospora]GGS42575.1 hypothetical protein GCM10010171_41900 [Actinokineospora fastidiosa]